jgi:HK97 gp10 family phage protein
MGYGFKIEGIENIQKAIEQKRKEIGGVFNQDLNSGADEIVTSAKIKAPKDKHNLEKAIDKNEVRERGGKFSIYVGIKINDIFTRADGWYARMQEKGTSKMKAHPYLRPAFDEHKGRINDKAVQDLKGILK